MACVAVHGAGAATMRDLGPSTVPVALVVLASLFLVAGGARPHTTGSRRSPSLGTQLVAQAALLSSAEAVEAALGLSPAAGAGLLHDPLVWVGLLSQVAMALWVHAGARTLHAVRWRTSTFGMLPTGSSGPGPGRAQVGHDCPPEAGSLVRRGPPVARFVTVRS